MRNTVFLDYTQHELDRAYDQRVWAPDADRLLARWLEAVETARHECPGYALAAYGADAGSTLDIYPTSQSGSPIHIHIHGGAWRSRSKEDGAILAPAMTAAGMHFVVPDFALLPTVRLPGIVDQLTRAVGWVYRNAAVFGGDRERIILSGHSSGAHLAAVLSTQDFTADGLPADVLKAVVCVSGSYDLEPVMLSARRQYLDLSPEEVLRLSPTRQVGQIAPPIFVVWSEDESPEFARQGRTFAGALEDAGRLGGRLAVRGLNHFEIAEALGDPASDVHRIVLEALDRIPQSPKAMRAGSGA